MLTPKDIGSGGKPIVDPRKSPGRIRDQADFYFPEAAISMTTGVVYYDSTNKRFSIKEVDGVLDALTLEGHPAAYFEVAGTAAALDALHLVAYAHADIALNTAARHSHANKTLLDTYTQTDADLASAVSLKHAAVTASNPIGLTGQDLSLKYSTTDFGLDGSGNIQLVRREIVRQYHMQSMTGVLTSGRKSAFLYFPRGATIDQVRLAADVSGSITVDFWKKAFGTDPTDGDSITGGAPAALTAAQFGTIDISAWTKTITAGDCIVFNVDADATSITALDIFIRLTETD